MGKLIIWGPLLLVLFCISCGLVSNGKYSSEKLVNNLPCEIDSEGRPVTTPCELNKDLSQPFYLYPLAFGGRNHWSSSIPSLLPVFENSEVSGPRLVASIPRGWTEGESKLAVNIPSSFAAENIAKDVNILGLIGTLNSQYKSCDYNKNINELATEDCLARDSRNFIYNSAYNGRAQTCSIDNQTAETEGCFVNRKGDLYLIDATKIPSSCSRDPYSFRISLGTTQNECVVPKTLTIQGVPTSQYYYQQAFGGRMVNCNLTLAKFTSECWFSPSQYPVTMVFAGDNASLASCALNGTLKDGGNTQQCQVVATPPSPPKYIYTEAYGGRYQLNIKGAEIYCNNSNNDGACFFNAANKISTLGLTPNKIKANISIFGIVGTYYSEGEWASGAARVPRSYQIDLSTETQTYKGNGTTPLLLPNYHEVPLFVSEDDGVTELIDDDGSSVSPVDRSSWQSSTCGVSGTIAQRISDCGSKLTGASWDGGYYGNGPQSKWQLVSRLGPNKEVWKDLGSGMLWSSLVATNLNWCKASGSNNSNNPTIAANYKEDDPDDFCDQSAFQSTASGQTVVSACFEAPGLTTIDSRINNEGKANLGLSSSPLVRWRLPSLYDYQIAEYHGIRFVLPDMGFARSPSRSLSEWTATIYSLSGQSEDAWSIDSREGEHNNFMRSSELGVRCIGF